MEVCKAVTRTRFGLNHKEAIQHIEELHSEYSFDGLIYGAAIEIDPDLLDEIIANHMVSDSQVFGNSSETLHRCKNPKVFFSTLKQISIPFPEISFEPDNNVSYPWLIKHVKSSGGLGVRLRHNQVSIDEGSYFQRKIDGFNFSLTFLANGEEIKKLGFNTLWSEALGENLPYAYSGAINTADLSEKQQTIATKYATTITKEFNLIGLNSIDFILSDDDVFVLEVNPRIPATYELYETKYGDLIQEHIKVCESRKISSNKSQHLLRAHAIVYAPETIRIPKDFAWPLWTADRPQPQESIQQYEPICSVFSGGKNVAQVRQMIHTRNKIITEKLMRNEE